MLNCYSFAAKLDYAKEKAAITGCITIFLPFTTGSVFNGHGGHY
jgi:hypothetical protein